MYIALPVVFVTIPLKFYAFSQQGLGTGSCKEYQVLAFLGGPGAPGVSGGARQLWPLQAQQQHLRSFLGVCKVEPKACAKGTISEVLCQCLE